MTENTYLSWRERLNRALVLLEKRLDEPVSLQELAQEAHFSPYHFHRIFTGMVGESVESYRRRLRMERAALRLVFTQMTVTEIGLDAGYDSSEAFSRAFRKGFGLSPREYRKQERSRRVDPGDDGTVAQPRTILFPKPLPKGGNTMQVEIKTLPKMKVAFVRHIGPYNGCGEAWGKLCSWAGPKGLIRPDTLFLGHCHDDPDVTEPEKIRYDACLTVENGVAAEGEIGVQELGGGEYAVAVHKGPYENLKDTYAYMCGVWAPKSGKEIGSMPSIEIYRNDPEKTPPEELLTDVYVPLT